MKRPILGVALCGGRSSRMGADKSGLQVRPGVTQLEYTVQLLGAVCEEVALCVGREASSSNFPAGFQIVEDAPEVEGPMAGVLAALRASARRPVLAVACDMPFLEARHLVQLVNRRDPEKRATAFLAGDGSPDPMCALYEPSCLPALEASARRGWSSLRRFLAEAEVERVEADDPAFLASVNDPAALAEARARFQENA